MILYTIITGLSKMVQNSNVPTPLLCHSNKSPIKLVTSSMRTNFANALNQKPKSVNFKNLVTKSCLEKKDARSNFLFQQG